MPHHPTRNHQHPCPCPCPSLCPCRRAHGDLTPQEQALLKAVLFLRNKGQTKEYIQFLLDRPPPQWQVCACVCGPGMGQQLLLLPRQLSIECVPQFTDGPAPSASHPLPTGANAPTAAACLQAHRGGGDWGDKSFGTEGSSSSSGSSGEEAAAGAAAAAGTGVSWRDQLQQQDRRRQPLSRQRLQTTQCHYWDGQCCWGERLVWPGKPCRWVDACTRLGRSQQRAAAAGGELGQMSRASAGARCLPS